MNTPKYPESLVTDRLVLRPWRIEDRAAFAAMNRDPRVTRFLPTPITEEKSNALVERFVAYREEHGYGPWAVEVRGGAPFIGVLDLIAVGFEAPFTPAIEIGWRLNADHWNLGYATEAARAALAFAFETLGLDEVVAFTVPANLPSRRVMEKIGMVRDIEGDFEHPVLPVGHPLRPHVLYRIGHQSWSRD